jgi:hypothetical protein
MKYNNCSVRLGQNEQIASSKLLVGLRRILDGEGIGRHQCFESGQVSEHGCIAGELEFTLALDTFKDLSVRE